MAAHCRNLMRSTLQGWFQLSNRTLCLGSHIGQRAACLRLQEKVHCRGYASQTVSNTQKTETNQQKTEKEDEEAEDNSPEYIPKRKAKNPMMKVGYAWIIGMPAGIIGFILAKRQVDKNRLKQLKIRQRMKRANEGDYDSNRYNAATRTE